MCFLKPSSRELGSSIKFFVFLQFLGGLSHLWHGKALLLVTDLSGEQHPFGLICTHCCWFMPCICLGTAVIRKSKDIRLLLSSSCLSRCNPCS